MILVVVAVLTSLIFSPAATDVGRRRAASAPTVTTTVPAARAPAVARTTRRRSGPAGLVDTGNGIIVTGALTGDSPCERSGPPVSEGQTGKDAEGHAHRGPFKQEPLTRQSSSSSQAAAGQSPAASR